MLIDSRSIPGFSNDCNPDSDETVFATTAKSIIGAALSQENRNHEIADFIRALMDKDEQTGLDSFKLYLRKLGDILLNNNLLARSLLNADAFSIAQNNIVYPTSVIFCDMNFFKKFNTRIGMRATDEFLPHLCHQIRDIVLGKVQRLTRHENKPIAFNDRRKQHQSMRHMPDFVGRKYPTGDEILICLPNTDKAGADACLQRINNTVRDTVFLVICPNGNYHRLTNVTLASGVKEVTFPLECPHSYYQNHQEYIEQLAISMRLAKQLVGDAETIMTENKRAMKAEGGITEPDIIAVNSKEAAVLRANSKVVFVDACGNNQKNQ